MSSHYQLLEIVYSLQTWQPTITDASIVGGGDHRYLSDD